MILLSIMNLNYQSINAKFNEVYLFIDKITNLVVGTWTDRNKDIAMYN